MPETRLVPRTKLWEVEERPGIFDIVLECVCGEAIAYPGHPDEVIASECPHCGRVYEAVEPERIQVAS